MVLMRTSSDEISSVRIRLRANMGQRLAVEDERGGIHLFSLWNFFRFFFYRSLTTKVDFAAAAAAVIVVIVVLKQANTARLQKVKSPSSSGGNKLILLKSTHLKGGMYSYLR